MILARVICLVAGYAFGLLQTSYIYGRMKGIDIRELEAATPERRMPSGYSERKPD